MSNIDKKDLYRLNILEKCYDLTDGNMVQPIEDTENVKKLFNIGDDEYLKFIGAITYLNDKNYLDCELLSSIDGEVEIISINLTSYGIDLIERIQRKKSIEEYESDFSDTAIMSFQNNSNSTFIINSPNTTVNINQTITKIKELNESTMSAEEKNELISKLNDLDETEKKSKWSKAKEIIGWIIDKGADAAVTVLPFILENLK